MHRQIGKNVRFTENDRISTERDSCAKKTEDLKGLQYFPQEQDDTKLVAFRQKLALELAI